MTHVFHRDARLDPPIAVKGDGIYIIDRDGKRYLDASGGAAVSCLGHSHPKVIEAVRRQVGELAYAHTSFFSTEVAERLADRLIADAPPGIGRVYFVSGGSEAMEAAMKMARQYHVERGEPERRHIIARWQSYHGNTLGALAVGGNRARRATYAPLLIEVPHISPCYAYRDRRDDETEAQYGLRVADELEAEIQRLGPKTVAAFVAETVVGATLGAVPPVPGYFKRIREICDRYGVLLILDEVMCGMGRTGTLHACEQEGIAPDLMTVAKGLGAGYQPIGAVLVAARVFEAFRDGTGAFQHGHTYLGHPVACAAALAVQDAIREENLLAKVRQTGEALQHALVERFGNHPHVGDIRGRGLFVGLELVADRASRKPFDSSRKLHARIKREAMARGLACYPMGGTADGESGDHVLLAPPFITSLIEVNEIVERLGDSVDAALSL
ncbi:aspartate aminotransferase family protein [Desertibaculum subflavum]|uniref:aspartate aminotransferase family protein n=1 Tax=Desertibaculum subflavum TaxID=2268458 RepID=UPI000E65EDD3